MKQWQVFEPFANRAEEIVLTPDVVREYRLGEWAGRFQLGTAGYRDLENITELFDLEVPFNPLTMALLTEASTCLYQAGQTVHLGGEVRPWTQEFINLAARIYAAHGIACRLRGESDADGPIQTTPIWMSSFGVFYEELAGGENFTASHSQNFKGGRKPMDGRGMQLLDQAARIEAEVRRIVQEVQAGTTRIIALASSDSPLIRRDFNVSGPYAGYAKGLVSPSLLELVQAEGARGFHVAVSTEGGSMGRSSRILLEALGIPTGPEGVVEYLHFQERSDYYGIGVLDGVNHGVDPGKWQIYKYIGAQELLLAGRSEVVFIWDPDGDRFNMVTTSPAALDALARANGLEVDPGDDSRVVVYFKPNQIYFMLLAFRLEEYRRNGLLEKHPWLVMETYPTSRSLAELASRFGLPTFHTPVGFKHFGNACALLEDQSAEGREQMELVDVRGRRHAFPGGTRVLLMAEESGGASMGGPELLLSKSGRQSMLALKEKDAFQIGLMALALASWLRREKLSFAEYYLACLDRYAIRYRFYERQDLTLFDESLHGDARRQAMEAGNRKKDRIVAFFRGLADRLAAGSLNPGQVTRALQERCSDNYVFPPVQDVYWAGDGTMVEFDGLWWQLRASGTDAVLRFYAEGQLREEVRWLNDAMIRLRLE